MIDMASKKRTRGGRGEFVLNGHRGQQKCRNWPDCDNAGRDTGSPGFFALRLPTALQ
jgi:hypothetical protein